MAPAFRSNPPLRAIVEALDGLGDRLEGSDPMLNDFKKVFDHHPVSEADLLHRINRALTGKGLRVQPATLETGSDGDATGYEFVHGAKRFRLRTAIEELARALGILGQPSQAEVHVHAHSRPCVCELRPPVATRRGH